MTTSTLSPYLITVNGSAPTLSNGNLTLNAVGSNLNNHCLATSVLSASQSGGKWYWECVPNTSAGALGAGGMVGISASGGLNFFNGGSDWLGFTSNTMCLNAAGQVYTNNGLVTTIATYVKGNTVCVAVDLNLNLIWFRTNNGNWNNSGTADPTTGTGGISISTLMGFGGSLRPGVGIYATGDNVTINLGGSAFTYTAPTGYSAPNNWSPSSGVNGEYKSTGAVVASIATSYVTKAATLGSSFSYKTYTSSLIGKTVAGQIQIAGVATSGLKVRVYDHVTGEFLGSAISDGSGNYSIDTLGRAKVEVIALDDPTYNGLIYSNVTPT